MSKTTVTVEHIGSRSDGRLATSRLMVNGYGVANWRSFVPVTDEADGSQYAEEVARCLRMALGMLPDPQIVTEPVRGPNGMLWGKHSLPPFRRMTKYLRHERGPHGGYYYQLECGHGVIEGRCIDLTNFAGLDAAVSSAKQLLDAQFELQNKKFVLVRTSKGLVLRKRPGAS